jgi:hypothetical protein
VILMLYITESCLSKPYNTLIFQIKDTEAPFVMRPPPHPNVYETSPLFFVYIFLSYAYNVIRVTTATLRAESLPVWTGHSAARR